MADLTGLLPTVGTNPWNLNPAITAVNADVESRLLQSAAAELIRDTMGTALVGGDNIEITVNDPGDTITITGQAGGGGVSEWGDIDGTLSNQTDLNDALASKVPTSRTISGHDLTANFNLVKGDVGLGNVDNTADSAKSFTGTQVAQATTTARGTSELATNLETQTGTDATRTVTPAGLGSLPPASAYDIPYIEGKNVGQALAELFAFKDAIEAGGVPITNTALPEISGDNEVGDTVTASTGTWSQTPDSYTYQWRRNGSAISGATASTRVLTSDDLGTDTITVTVTAVKSGFTSGSATSAPISVTGAALPFSVAPITPIEKVYSGNTLTFDKADAGTLVAGTKLYVVLYSNLNSGGNAWSAVSGSGSWSIVGPTFPGSSATNRVLTILTHTVTDPSTEPTTWQFTRSGVNGRNAGAMIKAQSATLDAIVTDYTGTSVTNGRQTASLTATSNDAVQIFVGTKEGTSTSVQNPTVAPAGFTQIVNEAINDGSGTSAQSFFYLYTRDIDAGATGTSNISWSAGATNPLAQSFILKAA